FQRVIPGFVRQSGCPEGNGTGGPGDTIKSKTDGNLHTHKEGSLSMAQAGKDRGGSQVFIINEPQPQLNGDNTVFGQVTSGIEHAKSMQNGDQIEKIVIED